MNAHERSWTLMDANGRSWTLMDGHFSKDAHGWSWTPGTRWVDATVTLVGRDGQTLMDAHGCSWTVMDAKWTLGGRWVDA